MEHDFVVVAPALEVLQDQRELPFAAREPRLG
jgi:hypothetical protein